MRHYSTWNPQNGYIPRPREYVRLVGACHPRSLGQIVLVTKVYEDEDGWWFESSHQERGEVLYSSGILGGVEPVDPHEFLNLDQEGVPVW
jgi:hypothetical protein